MTDHKRIYSQRGDDYLIEAQRVCGEDKREYNKPAPRCPYCGEAMYEAGNSTYRWYMCPRCLSGSTRKSINKTEYPTERLAVIAALQKSRKAAINRWQEPNRVLTLEEIEDACKLDNEMVLLWVEFNCNGVCTLAYQYCTMGQAIATVYLIRPYDEAETDFSKLDYRKKWRCWLRKPTAEEMATMPWREK